MRQARWDVLENKRPWRSRAVHEFHHQHFAETPGVYVVVYHDNERDYIEPPLVTEIYTSTEPVAKEALRQGHAVGPSLKLDTGYDFHREPHGQEADRRLQHQKPFGLMLASPCGWFSPLMELITHRDRRKLLKIKRRRAKEKRLVDYCVKKAKEQLREGRHFIIENPSRSRSWRDVHSLLKLTEKADELGLRWIQMDQCMAGLRGPGGGLIKKTTWFLTSSEEVAEELKVFQCSKDHEHEWSVHRWKTNHRACWTLHSSSFCCQCTWT